MLDRVVSDAPLFRAGSRNAHVGAGTQGSERARAQSALYAATLDTIGSSVGEGRRTADSGASAALKETAMRGV